LSLKRLKETLFQVCDNPVLEELGSIISYFYKTNVIRGLYSSYGNNANGNEISE